MENELKHIESKEALGIDRFKPSHRLRENYADMNELQLWKAFKNGEEEALIFIYRKYVNVLYNYGCQFTKEKELIRDVVQEFFIDLIKNKHNLGDTDSIKYYLFRSFRRRMVRVLKKESKFQKENIEENESGFLISQSHEMRYIKDQLDIKQKEILKEKFNVLPRKQREALLLYFYEGLSYKEIAGLFDMTRVKSARVLIYRAIEKLGHEMKNYREFIMLLVILCFAG